MLPFVFPLSKKANRKIFGVGVFSVLLITTGSVVSSAPLTRSEESTLVDSAYESIHWYYEGLKMREVAEYDKAVKAFTRFLSENPDHVYADRAQFMIFDSHFKNQDYALALSDSILFENRFADSFKYPNVLLNRGLALLSLGKKKEALTTLDTLVALFPKSEIAKTAQEKLVALKGVAP